MADLTSTAKVKRALGIPVAVTMHDEFIDDIVAAVDYEILAYTGQVALTNTLLTSTYDIERAGTSEIMLRSFPVAGISSVVNAGSTLVSTDYYVDQRTGALRLTGSGASFEQGVQKVAVEYRIGYDSGTPQLATVAHAATTLAVARFNATRHAGMSTEAQGAYRYSLDVDGIPSPVRLMLASFVRIIARDSAP